MITIILTSNDIAAQFVISHFIIIIINEWMAINEWIKYDLVVMLMTKKSVLHLVADDWLRVFEDKEEAQFEMLLSLITNDIA